MTRGRSDFVFNEVCTLFTKKFGRFWFRKNCLSNVSEIFGIRYIKASEICRAKYFQKIWSLKLHLWFWAYLFHPHFVSLTLVEILKQVVFDKDQIKTYTNQLSTLFQKLLPHWGKIDIYREREGESLSHFIRNICLKYWFFLQNVQSKRFDIPKFW